MQMHIRAYIYIYIYICVCVCVCVCVYIWRENLWICFVTMPYNPVDASVLKRIKYLNISLLNLLNGEFWFLNKNQCQYRLEKNYDYFFLLRYIIFNVLSYDTSLWREKSFRRSSSLSEIFYSIFQERYCSHKVEFNFKLMHLLTLKFFPPGEWAL